MELNILEIKHFTSHSTHVSSRLVKDYELDLELQNNRSYYYQELSTKLRRGDIIFRTPGTTVRASSKQNTYTLSLDFAGHVSPENYSRNLPGPIQPLFHDSLLNNLPCIFHPHSTSKFIAIYEELLNLPVSNTSAGRSLAYELLHSLNAEICHSEYQKVKPAKNACMIVKAYMRENLHKTITLSELADLVHLDKSYLTRLFREATGQTPINMLIDMRMARALDLVSDTDIKICEVAEMCGYHTHSFFIKQYREKYGVTPHTHRIMLQDSPKNYSSKEDASISHSE